MGHKVEYTPLNRCGDHEFRGRPQLSNPGTGLPPIMREVRLESDGTRYLTAFDRYRRTRQQKICQPGLEVL
jgi:hypothetical protein